MMSFFLNYTHLRETISYVTNMESIINHYVKCSRKLSLQFFCFFMFMAMLTAVAFPQTPFLGPLYSRKDRYVKYYQ